MAVPISPYFQKAPGEALDPNVVGNGQSSRTKSGYGGSDYSIGLERECRGQAGV